MRRAAVLAAAFLLGSYANATAEPPQHALPAGSTVVFVVDGHLDIAARRGSTVRVHLRDDLVLDGKVLAAAGTPAQLVIGGTTTEHGARVAVVGIDDFTSTIGLIPVRPAFGAPAIEPGTMIEAQTLARIDHLGDRFAITVPFPFRLSNEPPLSVYTPTPAKTANPVIIQRGKPRTLPSPGPSATASGTPAP